MKNTKLKLDPLSIFSHELKTPLSSLKLGLDIIKKRPGSKQNEDILNLMEEELNNLIEFINTQLDLKLIQEKQDLLKFQWDFWINPLSKALSTCHLPAKQKNITFKINNQTEIPKQKEFEIFMDPQWMSQVLINLLSNALKFSPKNTTIFIDYKLLPNNTFQCSVTDEGERLSEKDSFKLFETYYTGTQKEGIKGTGLGLALVKAVVENHGGSIQAFPSKEAGKGSVFSFFIPKIRTLKKTAA